MALLSDLAGKLQQFFNSPITAQGIGARNPINYGNVARQVINVATPIVSKAYNTKSISIPELAPYNPISHVLAPIAPRVSPHQILDTARSFIPSAWQTPAQFGVGLALSDRNALNQKQQSFYQPNNPVAQLLMGKEPIKTIQGQGQDVSNQLQKFGINTTVSKAVGVPAIFALGALNLVGGEKAGSQEAIALAKKAGSLEELNTALKNAPKARAYIENFIKDTKSPINSIEDFFQTIKKTPSNIAKQLDEASNLRTSGKNMASNVRSYDNPLIGGETAMTDWKASFKPTEPFNHNVLSDAVNAAFNGGDRSAIEKLQNGIDPEYTPVIKKVHFFDRFATPSAVLEKIGLGKQAKFLRTQYEGYLTQLPKEIESLRNLANQVPGKQSSENIFKYLDGQIVDLSPKELEVAGKIKTYLAGWADKLKLPEDKRVSSYITHIFEKGTSQAEFNDEVAKLIDQRVAGSVYDPFLQARKQNELPYVQDVWRALDAYSKRAVRKFYMDPALEQIANKSNDLELSQYRYVQNLTDRINLRPTHIDSEIDNWLKGLPKVGYRFGQRPTAVISQRLRQTIYRGTLGLNVSSAIRNLSQAANTYSELGERWTITGYLNLARDWNTGELEQVGVLRDSFIQDKQLTITKQFLEKFDSGLMYLFQKAEKINRGAAYFGAKAKALEKGMSEDAAIEYAKELVRKTQFQFGSIDTPIALSSDISKTLFQLQSYNLKQIEFLKNKVIQKDLVGIIRYVGATLAMGYVLKKAFGMSLDLLPINVSLTPSLQIGSDVLKSTFGSGQDQTTAQRNLPKDLAVLFPAGVQIKKSFQGLRDFNQGYNTAPSGQIRYPIQQNLQNQIRGAVFGANSFPEAQNYYDSGASILGKSQTELIKQSNDKIAVFNAIQAKRQQDAEEAKLKQQAKTGGTYDSKNDALVKLHVEFSGQGAFLSNGDYAYKNKNGNAATLSIAPSVPGNGIEAFANKNERFTQAKAVHEAFTSGNINKDEYGLLLKKLGVEAEDVRYDSLASHSNDIKTQFIESKDLTHAELIDRLTTGRVVSLSGTQFASNGVIDALFEDGYIDKAEQVSLKAIKIDKSGNSLAKSKGRKPKKIGAIKLFKIAPAKTFTLKAPKPAKLKFAKNPAIKISKSKQPAKFKVNSIATNYSKNPTLKNLGARLFG